MCWGSWKSSSAGIAGVQWSSTVGSTLWGMAPGVAIILGIVLGLAEITLTSCGSSGQRGGVLRVLQARVLSWSRPESLPRVVPMPLEGSAEGKVRRRHGELAA